MPKGPDLLRELEAEVRRTTKPEPAPAPPAARAFPEDWYSDHPDFDWDNFVDCLNDAISDGDGSFPRKASYWRAWCARFSIDIRFTSGG